MTAAIPETQSTRPNPALTGLLGEQRIILDGISWETYERIVDELKSPGIRLTFDHGFLEIMSPSWFHEKLKRLGGRMIEVLADHFDMPFDGGGSTTFRRRERLRGLEPDECFWLLNAAAVLGRAEIDLSIDPPPDLAMEIDITDSSLDKLDIYAELRIPEMWQYDGKTLRVFQLGPHGVYTQVERSPTFPTVPLDELANFLHRWDVMDEGSWVKSFRDWVSAELPKTPES